MADVCPVAESALSLACQGPVCNGRGCLRLSPATKLLQLAEGTADGLWADEVFWLREGLSMIPSATEVFQAQGKDS